MVQGIGLSNKQSWNYKSKKKKEKKAKKESYKGRPMEEKIPLMF